jgi:hypothetical protein
MSGLPQAFAAAAAASTSGGSANVSSITEQIHYLSLKPGEAPTAVRLVPLRILPIKYKINILPAYIPSAVMENGEVNFNFKLHKTQRFPTLPPQLTNTIRQLTIGSQKNYIPTELDLNFTALNYFSNYFGLNLFFLTGSDEEDPQSIDIIVSRQNHTEFTKEQIDFMKHVLSNLPYYFQVFNYAHILKDKIKNSISTIIENIATPQNLRVALSKIDFEKNHFDLNKKLSDFKKGINYILYHKTGAQLLSSEELDLLDQFIGNIIDNYFLSLYINFNDYAQVGLLGGRRSTRRRVRRNKSRHK